MSDKNLSKGVQTKASDSFRIPVAGPIDAPTLYSNAGNLPLMHWPDNSTFFEGNCWIDSLRRRGLSFPTIKEYCYEIAHLVRFAHLHKVPFYDFSNYHFSKFMKWVKKTTKRHVTGHTNRPAVIGQQSLNFLEFVGTIYSISNFIGAEGIIRATKTFSSKKRNGIIFVTETWKHEDIPSIISFPPNDQKLLEQQSIKSIKQAIRKSSFQPFVRARRRVSFSLLEELGPRRGEVVLISAGAVWEAKKRPIPTLLLTTLKKRVPTLRLMRISNSLLNLLDDFIRHDLKVFLSERNVTITADTPLILSTKTLKAIQPNTVTQEFSKYRHDIGIDTPVSPHMLRHNAFTNDRLNHLASHPTEKVLSEILGMKSTPEYVLKSMEKYGHASPSSQTPYIHTDISNDFEKAIARYDSQALSALQAHAQLAHELLESSDAKDIDRARDLVEHINNILQKSPLPND